MKRKFHCVITVTPDKLNECITYYSAIFDDVVPVISFDAEEKTVVLGNGKAVIGAWFNADYCNFYIVADDGVSGKLGVDHIGIEYEDADDLADCMKRLGRVERFETEPSDKVIWELWTEN